MCVGLIFIWMKWMSYSICKVCVGKRLSWKKNCDPKKIVVVVVLFCVLIFSFLQNFWSIANPYSSGQIGCIYRSYHEDRYLLLFFLFLILPKLFFIQIYFFLSFFFLFHYTIDYMIGTVLVYCCKFSCFFFRCLFSLMTNIRFECLFFFLLLFPPPQ